MTGSKVPSAYQWYHLSNELKKGRRKGFQKKLVWLIKDFEHEHENDLGKYCAFMVKRVFGL
jgi:hypothetical protein